MNKCPLTYEPCDTRYSATGLKSLSPKLGSLKDFPYSKSNQLKLAFDLSDKLSFSGVQPKIGGKLNIKEECFEPCNHSSNFIFKLPHEYYEDMPENEDLTMKLAKIAKIEVPLHGLIYAKDGSLLYFIKRFDRQGRKKFPVEDFGQLSGVSADEKYDSSMEKVASLIEQFCTFNLVEKAKLFRLVLFCFLIGNEDLHLKNLSVITVDNVTKLTPSYDLVNSTLARKTKAKDELALPLRGKKSNFKREDLVSYYGKERLGLSDSVINEILQDLNKRIPLWRSQISKSFLPAEKKDLYIEILNQREKRLFS